MKHLGLVLAFAILGGAVFVVSSSSIQGKLANGQPMFETSNDSVAVFNAGSKKEHVAVVEVEEIEKAEKPNINIMSQQASWKGN